MAPCGAGRRPLKYAQLHVVRRLRCLAFCCRCSCGFSIVVGAMLIVGGVWRRLLEHVLAAPPAVPFLNHARLSGRTLQLRARHSPGRRRPAA